MQIIKNPTCEDLKPVLELFYKVFSENPETSKYTVESTFERLSNSKDPVAFLIHEEGDLAGFAMCYERITGYFHLWELGVDEKLRGRGLATKIYEAIESYSKENNYKGVTINTFNRFPDSLRLAIKRGYKIVGLEAEGREENDPKINLRLDF